MGTKTRVLEHRGPIDLESDKRPLPPIHSAHNGIVFTDEDKASAFANSLENQCQTNVDPDVDDEEAAENLRKEEPDDDELIRETNPDEIEPSKLQDEESPRSRLDSEQLSKTQFLRLKVLQANILRQAFRAPGSSETTRFFGRPTSRS